MTTSNTLDCFRYCVGKTVKGVLFNALPLRRRDLSRGSKTLIFNDGTGLTISSSGSFWIDSAEDVRLAIKETKDRLEVNQKELSEVLELAASD